MHVARSSQEDGLGETRAAVAALNGAWVIFNHPHATYSPPYFDDV